MTEASFAEASTHKGYSLSEEDSTPVAEPVRQTDLRPLSLLLPFLRPYALHIIGAFISLVVAAVTVLALGQGVKFLVDEGFSKGNPLFLDKALLILFGVIALLAISTYGRFTLVSWVAERVVADMRKAIFNRLVTVSPSFYESTRLGEILSRMTTDSTLLHVVVGSSVSLALRNTLLFIGGSIMMLITSPKLTGLAFLVVPLVLFPILVIGRKVRRLSRANQDRIADIGARIEETLSHIRIVQSFVQEKNEQIRFAEKVEAAFSSAAQRIKARAWLTVIVIVLVFSAIGTVLWIGGHDVLSGRITAGELSSFIFYAVLVAGAVGAISEVIGDLQRAAGATERLFDLLNTESTIHNPPNPRRLPDLAMGSVTFDNVAFSYPARPDIPVLQSLSFDIKPGETVAIVGPSGTGKTTIFQLLMRFYDPQGGRILLDGVDLKKADLTEVRSQLGVVPQETAIFSASAWENIRYGRPEATDEEVRAAAVAAHAAEFLDRLPEGFNTYLGEKGVRLSGGQRQRISIARAILKNPPVLLLDEATSALDAESERVVQKALEKLMQNRTTLIIAHRLATVMRADRILVLDQGRLLSSGKHRELLETCSLYARLASLQFNVDNWRDGQGDGSMMTSNQPPV